MEHRVRKVIALAEEFLHKGWSPAKLAALVNLSPSRLHQLFKAETGVPPARYLRQLRMRRARELLETTHLSVKQVIASVGLTDESHFVRDFKKTCGLTPARYRERFLNNGQNNGSRAQPPYTASFLTRAGSLPSSERHASAPAAELTPPLLLRRASHPRQFSGSLRVSRRRELLSLLKRRHAAFAQLTAAATDRIVREMPADRTISYRPRRSGPARRLPPSAEHPRPPRAGRS